MKTEDQSSVWVLVYHINEYDQDDAGYFEACFSSKPTPSDLAYLGLEKGRAEHYIETGKRMGWEYRWYEIKEAPLRQVQRGLI